MPREGSGKFQGWMNNRDTPRRLRLRGSRYSPGHTRPSRLGQADHSRRVRNRRNRYDWPRLHPARRRGLGAPRIPTQESSNRAVMSRPREINTPLDQSPSGGPVRKARRAPPTGLLGVFRVGTGKTPKTRPKAPGRWTRTCRRRGRGAIDRQRIRLAQALEPRAPVSSRLEVQDGVGSR